MVMSLSNFRGFGFRCFIILSLDIFVRGKGRGHLPSSGMKCEMIIRILKFTPQIYLFGPQCRLHDFLLIGLSVKYYKLFFLILQQ